MKTVRQHIDEIKDDSYRNWCLSNLDKTKAEIKCYAPSYAMMLGVNQANKLMWEQVCIYLVNQSNQTNK